MRKTLTTLLFLYFILRLNSGLASSDCAQLNAPKDVLNCALLNHPDLIRGTRAVYQAESFEDKAGQIPNPEINVKSTYGKSMGDDLTNSQIDLPFTIEIGGKRSSRIEKALAEKDQVSSEFLKTKEDVYIFVMKTLHRIRQVHSEIRIVDEALGTFSKIQKQYRSRPKLGPEQEVSLSVFQLAEGDYKFRKSVLETEENTLEKNMGIAIGKELPHTDSILPQRNVKWDNYSYQGNELKGSDFKLSLANLKIAQADLELARSESWPDLKIGPTVENISEGPFVWQTYGINLSLPLPFFNVNGGGRAVAKAGLMKAEQSLELRKRELNQFQSILLTQYQKAVSALKGSTPFSEMENKHKSVERQFSRGVIPSSLVIEAHRQMVDFATSQNEQELIALEALLKLKALDGSLFEAEL